MLDTVREQARAAPAGEATGLTYRVRGKVLIDRLDLRMAPHTLSVVMGPNGAGKSLLLRLLHGMLAPSEGEVRWGGRPIGPQERRRQAMVFQRPVLLRRSVAANIRFALRLRGARRRQVVNDLLREAGLSERARQPARALSGGEQQRLSLVRALALEPDVLFLDEPTASLDPASTAVIEAIIRRAHGRRTKVILVTHDPRQARRLAEDVIFLEHGRLREHTPAETFFREPVTQAAKDYLAGRLPPP